MNRIMGAGFPGMMAPQMGPNLTLQPDAVISPIQVNLPLAPGSAGNGGAGANNAPASLTQINNAQSPFTPYVQPVYAFPVEAGPVTPQEISWWVPLAVLGGLAAVLAVSSGILTGNDR